jgi:hypothetical protein
MAESQYAGFLAKKNRHGIFDTRWVIVDFESLKMSYWKNRDASFKGEPLSYVRIRSIKDIDWTETMEKGTTVRRRSLIGGGVKFVFNMAENHEPKQYTWRASTGPDALVWKQKLEKAMSLAAEAPKEEENTDEYKIGSRRADQSDDSGDEPPPKQEPPKVTAPTVAAPTVAPTVSPAPKEGDALVEELQKKQKALNLEGTQPEAGASANLSPENVVMSTPLSTPNKSPPAPVATAQASTFEEF